MAKKGVTNWTQLKHEYVTSVTPISYTALAAKHDLRRETVTVRGKREHWPEERESFFAKVDEKKTEIKAISLAEEGAEFDRTCFTIAKWLSVEAVNGKKAGEVSLREAAGVIATAQGIAKIALSGVQVRPSGGQEGVLSIDELLNQYGTALGLEQDQGTDNPSDHPAEPLHSSQATESEAVPVHLADK